MADALTFEVPRTARLFLSGPASGPGAGPVHEAWCLLHGYGQLAEPFLASLAALEGPERLLLAPEGLSRFYLRRGTGEVGASWMTREARVQEICDAVRYLDLAWERARTERALGDAVGLRALGFSQGGATAARWAVLGSAPVRELVSYACPLPPDLDLDAHRARVRALRWTFVLGDEDRTIEREAFELGLERLRAAGVEPRVLRFAGGHALDPAVLACLAAPGD